MTVTGNGEARGAALAILKAVRAGKRFEPALDAVASGLSGPDRRLAHEIAAGVLRERRTLDRQISAALTRPSQRMAIDVTDVLRIGAYQLVRLKRVPDYAAVQSTVELARANCGAKTIPFVNAVLRRLARERIEHPGPAGDSAAELAEAFSHPDWLVERWISRFGRDATKALLSRNNAPPALVIHPARWTAEQIERSLSAEGIAHERVAGGEAFAVTGGTVTQLPGYSEGGFIVQDPTQRRLLEYAAVPASAQVWDVCAAPGGKAMTLASGRRVFATDRSRKRLSTLRENIARVAPDVRIACANALEPPWRNGTFEAVLVDAPCSATGTIARHPDARWRLTPRAIADARRQQQRILNAVADTVAPGGLLVYVTCSLEREENEDQIDGFLRTHPRFAREDPDLRIYPPDCDTDGGFGARLRRAA